MADEAPVADRFLVASRRISCQGQPGADRPAHVGIVLADPACEDNGVDALLDLDAAGIDFGLRRQQESLLRLIDFSTELMQGMLSMLLFAPAPCTSISVGSGPIDGK